MSVEQCAPSIAIGELTLGLSDDDVAPALIDHLLRCASCVAEWDAFRAFLSKSGPSQIPDPLRSSFQNRKEGAE
jgi:hypothetical protein